jgi:hypothetical protein
MTSAPEPLRRHCGSSTPAGRRLSHRPKTRVQHGTASLDEPSGRARREKLP